MKPMTFILAAAIVVAVLIVMSNQQGLAVYIVRTFLHGGR